MSRSSSGAAGLGGWGSAQAWDQPLVLRAPTVPGCDAGDPRLGQADVLADAAAQEPDPTQAVRTALTALRQAQALGCAERSRAGAVLVNVLARLGSQQLGRHTSALQGLAAAADSRVVALDGDGQVMVWDREAPGQVLAGVSGAQAVGRSGDGRWLAVGDAQGGLRWWELADGEWVAAQSEVPGVERATRMLAFDGEGRTIRVDDDGQVEVTPWEALVAAPPRAELLVNCTSVGMRGGPAEFPIRLSLDLLPAQARVVDAVYPRPAGGLLERAAARGLRVQDGLPMLLWQGVRALERWLDLELSVAAVAAMRAALYAENLPDQPGPR